MALFLPFFFLLENLLSIFPLHILYKKKNFDTTQIKTLLNILGLVYDRENLVGIHDLSAIKVLFHALPGQ